MIAPRVTQPEWASLVDLLRCRAAADPDAALFAFLADRDESEAATMTRGELDRCARAVAVRLRDLGLGGTRALLLYPPGLDFIAAFFGCLYAGVVAVPAHLPRLNRPMKRLRSIVVDCTPSAILTSSALLKDAPRWSAGVPGLEGAEVLRCDLGSEDERLGDRWTDQGATEQTLAFLQYTSGSTSTPKGVMITHGNLLYNSERIQAAFGSCAEGHGVFWLPLFHDMGLIGGVIQTLYCGGSSRLFSPVAFLQRPLRWLQAISRTGAIISGGPNFAYDLCVEKTTPEQRAALDLSHWRVAFNGAEPVRAETLDRFAEAFAPAGFRREAFLPCYGLAEATLLVSGNPTGLPPVVFSADAESLGRGEVALAAPSGPATRLVSSGRGAQGHVVAIVDPATARPCPSDRIGEIWVSGPSIAQGYWNRPEESREVMGARLIGAGDRSFLRTGDLGFLRDSELFVTGRIKDLIILRGRNIYPQDVEWAAESSHPALRASGGAAFSVEAVGEERLAIVLEVERRLQGGAAEEIFAAVRREVALALDLEVFAIRLIKATTLPRTSSGKVQRHACREAFMAGSLETVADWTRPDSGDSLMREIGAPVPVPLPPMSAPSFSRATITAWLAAKVAVLMGLRPDDIDIRAPMASFGVGSLHAVRLAAELEEWLGRKLTPTVAYDYPTIDSLAGFLAGNSNENTQVPTAPSTSIGGREPIAIIGIGCRFPGAEGPAAFWELLRTGAEAIGEVPDSRWTEHDLLGLDFPRRSGFLKSIDRFDAGFFRITPREAMYLDPQQRMLLEVAWEALEDGGQVPDQLAGTPVGVFVGISTNDYAFIQVKRGGAASAHRVTGNAGSIAANRVSHFFDFRAPSLAIDTACSSSLVATLLACRSIWDGESELALAGGSNLLLQAQVFAGFARCGFLSPDGHCRAFDAQANGYVRGEGVGIVVLKPLSRALADGDPIYAVIRGGAVNQDGRTNGLTAPSGPAQEAVLRSAYRHAGVAPELVDYVEAHGTGTPLGDPIELAALGAVLGEGRDARRRCALGSVKTNIGHLEAAAGVAGLIKAALALHHRLIPASLHFSRPNPHVDLETMPLRVASALEPWPGSEGPARAGVSAFGFGGTNAHLVLEEAPRRRNQEIRFEPTGRVDEDVVIPLSAKTPDALFDLCRSVRDFLSDASNEIDLRDVAYTAGARRGHHDHRLALVVSSRDDAIDALDSFLRGEPHWSTEHGRRPRGRRPGVVSVFPGTNGFRRGAGRELFHREPAFRSAVEQCDAILTHHLDCSPAAEVAAGAPSSAIGETANDRAILFTLEVALAALWKSWGIIPDRVVGVGVGELAAAYVGGTMSLEDAARIAAGPGPDNARFPDTIAEMANEGLEVFLEMGPQPVLGSAIKQCLGSREGALVLPSLLRGDAGLGALRSASASLYARGFDIEWSRVSSAGRFVRLPNYPWQRDSYWLEDELKGIKNRSEGPSDRIKDKPGAIPHKNGLVNGQHTATFDEQPALVAHRDIPDDPAAEIPDNGVAPQLSEIKLEGFSGLPAHAVRHRLLEYFRERVAAVLGLTSEQVDPDRPLMSLGLDSLSAMDLKAEIDAGLRTTLSLSMLMEASGIRELADRASELLAVAATESSEPSSPAESLPAVVTAGPPLSHGQQMLWYAHQFTTSGAAYHVLGAGRVNAELDVDAFRRAMRRVIAHQEALRTTFVLVGEKPAVRLLDLDDLILREDEWLPFENVASFDEAALQERLTELAHRPFDLESGPLFRVHVLCRSNSHYVFLLVFHHIIADFWSTAVFLDKFKTAYTAESAGQTAEFAPSVSSYSNFARWQHTMVAGEEGEQHWMYWRDQLARPLAVLDLPADFARPVIQSYRGAVQHFYLDSALTRAILALAESHGASLYTILLAAFQAMLARYSGQTDIVVGTPVAGRSRPGSQDLIGYFVNLLPMRGDLSGNPTFGEYLRRVRRTVSEGLEHQDFPFGLLVHRLQGSPDPSRPPLFQVMFAHQKIQPLDDQGLAPFALGIPGARLDLRGLAVESIAFERKTALFDLTMMTARDDDRLCVTLEYSTDLFKASTIDRMAAGFRNLLEAIVADPGRPIAELPLLAVSERHRLLGDWAEATAIPHEDIAIHHRFERQVELTPDAVALACGDDAFTYRELNRLANSLAYNLLACGVRPETVVGLYLDRWPARIVGLLGVLKAGGAYLPLDTDHPAERLAAMFEDSGAAVVLTEDHLRGQIPGNPPWVITFDPIALSGAGVEDGNPRVSIEGANLAYVIFTSGSTGRPKGVMVSHGSLLATASAWEHSYGLRQPPLRHLQAAGFAFDVFTGDWVRALTTGGTLIACPRPVLLDPAALAELIRRERIECLELVPAIADALATHLERQGEDVRGVRLLAVGSDTVHRRLYRRLCRLVGPAGRVVNSYGITEATIDSTYWGGPLEDPEAEDGPVPIGRSFPGARVYVLDSSREPTPVGVVGELYISGSGVARGYVSAPHQTAERFVPDPHGRPGARMYATGDRARWCEGGVIELLGRQDGQVKVRGFRVELAEVESVLARHPNVSQTVVVVVGAAGGGKRLAAYLVPRGLSVPTASDLRSWLKERIPDPMVPSSYVFLEAMPLSPNGKLDRSALPPPAGLEGEGPAVDYAPPRTTTEEILAGIAANLLGRSRIGVHDNFFEIGIDSIIGIQMVSRARQAGLALSPMHLFRHPSVAELAAAAESCLDHPDSGGNLAHTFAPFELAPEGIDLETVKEAFAQEGGIEDLYPLTPMQEGMLLHSLADPEAGHYIEQFVCRIRGELDPSTVQESWTRLAARHPALRSTIHWTDSYRPYQVVHRRADYLVEYQDWRGLSPAAQDERLLAYLGSDRRRGFVTSQPPLWRLTLVKVEDNAYDFIWSIHHVVIDGWCLSLLLHEFLDIDESTRHGREPALKPSRPFRDYVAWLGDRDDKEAQEYWQQALRGVTAAMPVGLEGLSSTRAGESRKYVAENEIVLPVETTTMLHALGRSRRLTLSTLIQGAWALLLSRYTGLNDVLFGVAVSGRPPELSGVESMVGMFVNSLPLRVPVIEEAFLVPWLRDIQAKMVELRRFEAVPLSRIQAWSDVPPGMPLFESIVIVQNLPFVASLQERADRLGIESARYVERTHYPLTITVVPGTELAVKIGFDSDRFDSSAIERTLGHLRVVLEAMAVNPERRLVDLSLMTESEQEQLVGQRNRSEAEPLPADVYLDQFTESDLDALIDRLR